MIFDIYRFFTNTFFFTIRFRIKIFLEKTDLF